MEGHQAGNSLGCGNYVSRRRTDAKSSLHLVCCLYRVEHTHYMPVHAMCRSKTDSRGLLNLSLHIFTSLLARKVLKRESVPQNLPGRLFGCTESESDRKLRLLQKVSNESFHSVYGSFRTQEAFHHRDKTKRNETFLESEVMAATSVSREMAGGCPGVCMGAASTAVENCLRQQSGTGSGRVRPRNAAASD